MEQVILASAKAMMSLCSLQICYTAWLVIGLGDNTIVIHCRDSRSTIVMMMIVLFTIVIVVVDMIFE